MNPRLKRNLKRVAVVHLGFVLGIFVTEWIRSLVQRHKPHEIVTFIDFSAMPPAPEAPTAEVTPEPPPPEPPPPAPPEPAPIPETPPPKPPKPPIERSTRRITRDQVVQPQKRPPTAEEIRRALGPTSSSARPANDFPFDWYFAVVRNVFYEAWQRPSTSVVPAGTSMLVSIRVLRDGTVKEHQIIRTSGNAVMDASVIRAVESVRKIQPLPAQYRGDYRDISVVFELAGM